MSTNPFIPWPYLDSLYDYLPCLRQPLAQLPPASVGREVAIIGAGSAGLAAAYELVRIGLRPVIFEAGPRIGGRLHTRHFREADGSPATAFAELGAMRIPTSARVFFHYAERFGMDTSVPFPDPGLVDTLLHYENQTHSWPGGQEVPAAFHTVQQNWRYFITPLVSKIQTPWKLGDMKEVSRIWQTYIERYKDKSFYQVMRNESAVWGADDLNRFGALGIGTGGFGPLYHVGFTEILRIIVHEWENNQKLVTNGVSELTNQFYTRLEDTPLGRVSVRTAGELHLNTPVNAVRQNASGEPLLVYRDPMTGAETSRSFPAVIVATTTRSMQMLGLTLPGQPGLPERVKVAVRNLHHMNSSKLFIRTRDKFWRRPGVRLPQAILTDELPRAVYLLDYPQTDNGVVCMSYTWGDDSTKVIGLSPQEYFGQCKRAIGRLSPELASHLQPLNNELLAIHWEQESYYHGAFKMQLPGQDGDLHAAYFNYLSALDETRDTGVYLAGDSVSWSGGWVEGALHTGLNAASAVARRVGATLAPNSPLEQQPHRYTYG